MLRVVYVQSEGVRWKYSASEKIKNRETDRHDIRP